MKFILVFFLFSIGIYHQSEAQHFYVKTECSDTVGFGKVNKLLILEPVMPHQVPIVLSTIKTEVETRIGGKIEYRFSETEDYLSRPDYDLVIDLQNVIESNADVDAILIIVYGSHLAYTTYTAPNIPVMSVMSNGTVDSYSRVNMYLYNNQCKLIAKSTKRSKSGSSSSSGSGKTMIGGIRKATGNAMRSMLRKLSVYNKTF